MGIFFFIRLDAHQQVAEEKGNDYYKDKEHSIEGAGVHYENNNPEDEVHG